MSDYITEYGAARKAAADARDALALALRQTEISPEIHALGIERMPVKYAECLRGIAAIIETLPALRDAVTEAVAAEATLAESACWYCHGTGLYTAPTSHLTGGKPVCWKCGGTGQNAKARKAVKA